MRTFHKIAGATLALQLILWTLTGFLFNYKYRYDEAYETLRAAAPSQPPAAWTSPGEAATRAGIDPASLRRVELLRDNRGYVYLLETGPERSPQVRLANAATGEPVDPLDAAGADAVLRSALAASPNAARYGAVREARQTAAPSSLLGRQTAAWELDLETGQKVTVNALTAEIAHDSVLNDAIAWTYRVHSHAVHAVETLQHRSRNSLSRSRSDARRVGPPNADGASPPCDVWPSDRPAFGRTWSAFAVLTACDWRKSMFRNWIAGCTLAALASVALPVGAQTLRPPKLEIAQFTLPNGLKVVALEDHSAPIVNVQVWYHVGSKDERPGRTGFAHLFEHLMFKGSSHVKPQEHAQMISDVGGVLNAGTNFDYTFYWETIPVNALDLALWLEADRMGSLTVDEANLKSERDVVEEELRLRIENPPYGKLASLVFATAFTKHSYRWLPIGSKEDLDAATLADVQAFHNTYYVPNNATITVVGDFKLADLKEKTEKYFGGIPKGVGDIPRPAQAEPAQTAERSVTNYDSKTPLPAVILAYHVPGLGEPDTYPLEVASRILSGGESSRLYRRLVYDKQLALQAAGQSFSLEDSGLFFFVAIMNAGKEASAGQTELAAEIERLQKESVTPAELEKARTQLVSEVAVGRQTDQEKADAIGAAATLRNDPDLVNQELARYQQVTAADVQRVAKKYFTPENLSVIYMLPESMRPAAQNGGAQ